MFDININNKIVEESKKFIGQKEIKGNLGFLDKIFEEYMKTVGWKKSHPWCAYFSELVWKLAYAQIDSTYVEKLSGLFSGSVMATWDNFSDNNEFNVDQSPDKGSLIVWNSYSNSKSTKFGHIGILIDYDGDKLTTVEGNTNSQGGREGIEVAKKKRILNFNTPQNGLKLLGFIHPFQP